MEKPEELVMLEYDVVEAKERIKRKEEDLRRAQYDVEDAKTALRIKEARIGYYKERCTDARHL